MARVAPRVVVGREADLGTGAGLQLLNKSVNRLELAQGVLDAMEEPEWQLLVLGQPLHQLVDVELVVGRHGHAGLEEPGPAGGELQAAHAAHRRARHGHEAAVYPGVLGHHLDER
eukprot:CAMPEP_0179364054 /NCGR_PEP_ID=MMETSP0797-20121207/81839_1 /TAXON_ID=47934 /ORGANISM="Dinophysis acuminata, Strain DAEP01" /LENGTH=114 /DNA_ID=CAMNT_0021079517 /DNA_START=161 /DNA_END=501 /DNA_ORIENTATION=+